MPDNVKFIKCNSKCFSLLCPKKNGDSVEEKKNICRDSLVSDGFLQPH